MDKEKLIELLMDEKIDDATRDDCAIYLAEFIDVMLLFQILYI
jgi:hypothetical protein